MIVNGYSSDVNLSLIADGRTFPLSQIGPGYAILREPASMEPCDAEIMISIDGNERRFSVRLVDGVVPFDPTIRMMRCVETMEQPSSA